MPITGTTEVVAIIGNPIVQVKSPGLMNEYLASKGRDAVEIPIELAPDGIDGFVAMVRRWTNSKGFVVTVPYKQAVAPKLDRLTARAARFGTVNVVRRDPDGTLEGEMLDGVGFIAAAARHGVSVKGKTATVVGAGGVASAIANSLCEEGVVRLRIQDLDSKKQDGLIATLRAAFPAIDIAAGRTPIAETDILVNGTPVGMNGDPRLPVPAEYLDGLTSRTFVADVVTSPAMTPFLTLAKARGCTIQVGTEMTETQIEALAAFMRIG